MKNQQNSVGTSCDLNDRLTATEIIDGVEHLVVLERNRGGAYEEVGSKPVPAAHLDTAARCSVRFHGVNRHAG